MTHRARVFAVVASSLAATAGTSLAERQAPVLPLVDLAGETARQVVVDREAGQYLGHPTTVLLEDGRTILCVYPKGHGKGPIVLKRAARQVAGGASDDGRAPDSRT